MVAIFTGLGAGFERGSGAALGAFGLLGSSTLGRAGEGVFLNAATGNLLINRQDEFLVGRGPDASVSRTYNSQGALDDANNDDWRQSTDRRVFGLTGTVNTANSTITRVSADGSEIVYTYGTWADGSYYRATDGGGAHDKLVANNVVSGVPESWTWTEGSSHISETYGVVGAYGQTTGSGVTSVYYIAKQTDADANNVTFAYSSGKLQRIATANDITGQQSAIEYGWTGDNITSVVTKYTDYTGVSPVEKTLTRVYYSYDGQNRLTSVTVDLSPDNTADSKVYSLSYTYDGTSKRVASITQSDGSALAISYVDVGGTYKVSRLAQTVATGETRTTDILYSTTTVGADTFDVAEVRVYRDATLTGYIATTLKSLSGQLREVVQAPAVSGQSAQTFAYTYDASGNVLSVTNTSAQRTQLTEYVYDAFGNATQITTKLNGSSTPDTTTTRTYVNNNLTSETVTGSNASSASASLTTRYVYDSEHHLRFTISAEGRVNEFEYATTGELTRTITYKAAFYTTAGQPDEAAMNSWGDANAANAEVKTYEYDARGGLLRAYGFSAITSSFAESTADGRSQINTVYDQSGALLSRWVEGQASESFVYDGLGRTILTTDLSGGTTHIGFVDNYFSSGNGAQTVVTTRALFNSGTSLWEATSESLVSTSVFNRGGELVTSTEAKGPGAATTTVGTQTFAYDKLGRLRSITDASGRKSYFLYDDLGRKTADVGHDGQLIEYRYDATGRLVQTIHYATAISTTTIANAATAVVIGDVRPSYGSSDIVQWSVYDANDRIVQTIQGDGSVTAYEYDKLGRLVTTKGYFNKVSVTGYSASPPANPVSATADAKDFIVRSFYDGDGKLIGSLNGEGYLTEIVYDAAGRKVQEIGYANATNSANRASGSFTTLKTGLANTSADRNVRYVYDGQGFLRFTIDALGQVTEARYWDGPSSSPSLAARQQAVGLVRETLVYNVALGALGAYDYTSVKNAVAALTTAAPRVTRFVYNDKAQLVYAIDAAGAVTRNWYDASGRIIKSASYSTLYTTAFSADASTWKATLDAWVPSGDQTRITRNFYNPRNELSYSIDAEGYVNGFAYDAEGRLISESRYSTKMTGVDDSWTWSSVNGASKGTARSTTKGYDNLGRLIYSIDAAGRFEYSDYYVNGALAQKIAGTWADNSRTVFGYDQAGKLIYEWAATSKSGYATAVGASASILTTIPEAQQLRSANSQYEAMLDSNGELLIFHNGEITWRTGTAETVSGASYRLIVDSASGKLTIYRDVTGQASVAIWQSSASSPGATSFAISDTGVLSLQGGASVVDVASAPAALNPYAGLWLTTAYAYDGFGNVISKTAPNGQVTSMTYDKANRLLSRTQVVGAQTITQSFEYNAFDAVKTIDPMGKPAYAYFDKLGRLEWAVDTEGYINRTSYNSFGEVASTIRYREKATNWTTTLSITTLPIVAGGDTGLVASFVYDNLGRVIYAIDAENYVTGTTYNAFGQTLSVTRYDNQTATLGPPTNTAGATTQFEYDLLGRLTKNKDAISVAGGYTVTTDGIETYAYDAYDRTSVTNRIGGVTTNVYDGSGFLVQETISAGGGVTIVNKYEYDARGNLTKKLEGWDAGSSTALRTTRYEYNKLNQLVAIYHDARSAVTSATGAASTVTPTERFYYDRIGNLAGQIDAAGARTFFWYDGVGRLTHKLAPNGAVTINTYDLNGRVTETKTFANALTPPASVTTTPPSPTPDSTRDRVTQYVYDNLGRAIEVKTLGVRSAAHNGTALSVDASAASVSVFYDYDAANNVVRTTDANGGPTYAYFDKLGRKVAQIDALGYRSSWTFDANGNVLTETRFATQGSVPSSITAAPPAAPSVNSNDRITGFTYDKLGRRLTESRLNVVVDSPVANTLLNPSGAPKTPYSSTSANDVGGVAGWNFWTNDPNGSHVHGANGIAGTSWLYNGAESTFVFQQGDTEAGYVYDINQTFTPVAGERYVFSAYTGAHRADVEVLINWVGPGQSLLTSGAAADAKNATEASGGQALSGYKRIWVGGVAPEWATSAQVIIRKHATKTGADSWMFVTRPQLERISGVEGPTDWDAPVSGVTATVTSTIRYDYNALGLVTRKTEGSGDQISYAYDAAGRLTSEQRSGYTDFEGAAVAPRVEYTYNGLNDVLTTTQRGKTTGGDRVTTYTYGAGGLLASKRDAAGFKRLYAYDAAGRVRREEYDRSSFSNTPTVNEAVGYDYDAEGRLTEQGALVLASGSWTRSKVVSGMETIDTAMLTYNAFGDIAQRGINGVYAEKFEYDAAGRLWRSTTNEGAFKYFMYDKVGNQTLLITTAGMDLDNKTLDYVLGRWTSTAAIATTNVAGVIAVITRFDARNQAIEVREPQRELSATTLSDIKTVRAYNAFGEVARETNALGFDIYGNPVESASLTYTYNTMGRLIKRESPTVAVTSTTGAVTNVRPTEEMYYDASGRLVASRDANGNLTRFTLLAGSGYGGAQALQTELIGADGSLTRVRYDIHGDARQIENPLYNASTAPQHKRLQAFDGMGRLTQLTQEGGLVQNYEYDGLGQRTKYWNNQLGVTKAELTTYDHQGRITQLTAIGGDVTSYAYGWNGSLATSGMGTFGGWVKTTTYANSKTRIESTDVFGRAISTTDLGGNVSNSTYDKAGRLLTKSGGNTRTYQYFNTGKLRYMGSANWYEEPITGFIHGIEYTDYLDTDFEYDIAGNLTKQRTGEHGTIYSEYYDPEMHEWYPNEPEEFDRTVSTQIATYDALGRMVTWDDLGYQDAARPRLRVPPTSHDFQYDANGNVRRSLATYRAIDAQGAYATSDTTQDYWYAYDALNRMVISKGQLVSGQVARGTTGVSMTFDLGGRRAYAIIQENSTTARREDYTYDAEGRLVETKSGTSLTSAGTKRADFTYDPMGQVTLQRDYDTNGTTVVYSRSVTYNDKSQVASDSTATLRSGVNYVANSTYSYGSGSTYALGSPLEILTVNFENSVQKKTNRTLNTYSWRDGPTTETVEYWNDWVGAPTVKNTSTYYYDIIGGKAQLKWVNIADGRPRVVTFMYDQLGQVIKRDEKDNLSGGDPHEVWYRFSGRQIGYVGNNGSLDSTYAQSITNRTATQGSGAFFNGSSSSTNAADFDLATDNLTSYTQGSSGGMYVVQQGDTLSSIASNLWGDAALWYKLAEANGLTAESELPEGLPLIIPTGVMRDSNTALTFKPYDPNEVMGNLSPTATAPPKGKKCGVIGQIIVAVIAVVVTAIIAPHAIAAVANTIGGMTGVTASMVSTVLQAGVAVSKLGAVATVVGGGVAAAAGSIASQVFGVATGIQEKFSWNAVALAAISGGIAGSGGNLGVVGRSDISNALRQGVANAITQGIGTATGLQKEFSWAAVAASAVGSYAGAKANIDSPFNVVRRGASLLADAATRSLIEGTDFGDNVIAALPNVIGQTLGEAIAGGVTYRSGDVGSSAMQSAVLNKNAALCQVASEENTDRLEVDITEGYFDGPVQVLVTEGYVDEPSLLQRIGGGAEFLLGVGAGFVSDFIHGAVALGDYVFLDMGGSALYWINEGIDAIVPGDLPNGYERSWADYTNANNIAGHLIGRAFSDPGGLANDIGTAFSAAVAESNGRESAFERGMTNPWGKVVTGVATLPFVASRVGALADLGNLGRGGRAGAVAAEVDEAARALRAADAVGDAGRIGSLTDDAWLAARGIADARVRQRILDAGLRIDLLDEASTPVTLARFDRIFPQWLARGRSFDRSPGRLGDIATRVDTINYAAEMERAGLKPAFEYEVFVTRADGSQGRRFIDLVGLDTSSGTPIPVRGIQFVKQSANGTTIRADEAVALSEIRRSINMPVTQVNTRRH